MSIADRLGRVRVQIDEACQAADRQPGTVTLIAVSKTHPVDAIREAMLAGQQHFGESYAQELRDKGTLEPELSWHFIGRLQRNKAKYVARHATWVHGLTHTSQAEALSARAHRAIKVMVNVNVGGEESKVGVAPSEVGPLLDALRTLENIEPVGLMCIPPPTEDPEGAAPYFEMLRASLQTQRARGHALTELSMGMTSDFDVAIRHGSTFVRVGTAIFGPRRT